MKILYLEDDFEESKSSSISVWTRKQQGEVKFIGNAYTAGKEIAKEINWCDCLAFSSTFIYLAQIQNLLTKVLIPFRKEPLQIVIQGYQVENNIVRLVEDMSYVWKTEEYNDKGEPEGYFELNESKADAIAYSMRLFKLFELVDFGDTLKPIEVLNERIERETKRLEFEKEYKSSSTNRLTGRKIKIGDLASVCGKEWSKLNPGDIVDELDMEKLDPRPGLGVWVMGLTEPVKLIGEDDRRGYNEYEIVNN